MERQLRRIKNKIFPKSPNSITELVELFSRDEIVNAFGKSNAEGSEDVEFFKGTISKADEGCAFFV